MNFTLKAKILIMSALCALCASVNCIAETTFRPPMERTTYDKFITTLSQNRKTYNALNDSISVITQKDEWILNFRHRSDVFAKLYDTDRQIIDAIKYDVEHYALADSIFYNNQETINSLKQLKSMYIVLSMNKLIIAHNDDPFLVKEVAKPICDLMIRKMPESEASLIAANVMATIYLQILRFCNDEQLEREFINYCEHCFTFRYRMGELKDNISSYVLSAYARIINNKSKSMGNELLKVYLMMEKFIADERMKPYFERKKQMKRVTEQLDSAASMSLLRNYYMVHHWNEHNAFTDSIALHDVNIKVKKTDKFNTLANKVVAEVYMGLKTFDQAFEECYAFYGKHLTPERPIDVTELSNYTNPLLNLIFLADSTSMTYNEKRAHIKLYADALLESVRSCKDNQSNNVRNAIVIHILGYNRMFKYFTSTEKEEFFHSMLVYTQVQTFAHSCQVSDLCVVVTSAIIDKRPELLVGMLGTRSKSDVRKKRQRFLRLIANAALYHDLGKLSMAELVKNDYRPMTNDEFNIIKTHPECGEKYLEGDSALMQYHDFVLGHHKWYDGKGGYPRDYDNTKSPYRTLVDVLTICDCLDAATDRVGRNYAIKKNYTEIVNEFQAQSGTRYNPDIVKILSTDKKLNSQLSFIVNDGWLSNYYDIFKDYFNQ